MKKQQAKISWEALHPQACDTIVPYLDVSVRAGSPTPPCESTSGESLMLPKNLMGNNPEFVIDVEGWSMKDLHIYPGDRVRVQMNVEARDGDVVVAELDGECTLKIYCTDEQGVSWLVPANEEFDAINLSHYAQFRIIGKVVGILKSTPHCSYKDCIKAIRRTQSKHQDTVYSKTDLKEILSSVSTQIRYARQWYAVCRIFMESRIISMHDYSSFVSLIYELLPTHPTLPSTHELKRLEVLSFSRPVSQWDPFNAPVSGQRFDDYKKIAELTESILRKYR